MSAEVNATIFGRDSHPTIYYIVGHGGKVSHYKLHIRFLKRGFRVVAFEYDAKVLMSGDPQRLVKVHDRLLKLVSQDMASRKVAGVYGISLGTFLGMNVMARTNIRRGVFNTGPANLVQVIWDVTGFTPVRDAFMAKGVSRQDLEAAWKGIELPAITKRMQDTRMLFMNSTDDNIITQDNWRASIRLLESRGISCQQIISRRYGHISVIVRNLLRLRRTRRFFRVLS